MTQLRSRLNPEDQRDVVEEPTLCRVGPNQFELTYGICAGTFFVDENTFRQAVSAVEEGRDNPFCCDECEEEYESQSHDGV
jgi:hypothetical protein